MATNRNFQDMLNEYLPNELLKEELIKRDYILSNVQKDNNWKGGNLVVPFKRNGATSVKFGGLTAAGNIVQSKYIRGNIADYRELWGSLLFDQRDLQEHDGRIPTSTFLRLLPDELEDYMEYVKEVTSIQFGSGPQFGNATSNGTAGGTIDVDKIDRFQIDQLVHLSDDTPQDQIYYVTQIDIDNLRVTLSLTRGGAPADLSGFLLANFPVFFHDGVYDAGGNHDTFISFRQSLLSAANGGDATLHGQTKLQNPILQAVNVDGTSITAANILDKFFDAFTEVRQRSKGRATEYLMSLKNYGSVMKQLELQKGAFRVVEEPKESLYGWMEMKIANVTGQVVKMVGIQEMDDDIVPLVDWRNITFRTNGYFRKRISPDGREYFEIRNNNGYQYICDLSLFGEMEYRKPGHSAIINNVQY
ncbi:MAG TPA: hypothetical protein VFI27_12260 [candidate division Zixibacteria bacterium]|nr:hypothetical protein [candidate division Zixibacteria bacterium]